MDYSKGRFPPSKKRKAIPVKSAKKSSDKTPAERAAEKGHPGVGTTKNGGPDFSGTPYLYPAGEGQRSIVTIKMTGNREGDFRAANEEAGFPDAGGKSPDSDYTWHHVDDYDHETGTCTMQLVKRSVHEDTTPHKGSCGQYDDHHGEKIYNPPRKKNPKKLK